MGARIAVVALQAGDRGLPAQELRAAITSACGFELCIAALRGGCARFTLTGSLGERLSAGSDKNRGDVPEWPALVAPS
jgi:hypothetical protein